MFTTDLNPNGHPLLPLNHNAMNMEMVPLTRQSDGEEAISGKLRNVKTDILVNQNASNRHWNLVRKLLLVSSSSNYNIKFICVECCN